MKIIHQIECPEKFSEFIFRNAKSCLYSPLNIKYSIAYEANSTISDLSFGIEYHEELLCVFILLLNKKPNGEYLIDGCGRPALFSIKQDLTQKEIKTIRNMVREILIDLLNKYPSSRISYYETLEDCWGLSIPGLFLLENGAIFKDYLTCIIDLSLPLATLSANVRKSYKSLINWGKNNLSLRLLNSKNIEPKDMDNFRQLHIKVAGRETRSKLTWDLTYEMIKADCAFMIDGWIDGKLVTASCYNFNQIHCYYGISASLHEHFDKPLLHASMWMAIEYAKNKGIHYFETGSQSFSGTTSATKKEIDISTFKRGFGGNIHPKLIIQK